mmetsp:Transcript_41250/g.81366  ORF Transcript_41250/g.81366 Transcript_41250/m.81366 type:complete len:202 (+) Transcript_41250:2015-2620(+)
MDLMHLMITPSWALGIFVRASAYVFPSIHTRMKSIISLWNPSTNFVWSNSIPSAFVASATASAFASTMSSKSLWLPSESATSLKDSDSTRELKAATSRSSGREGSLSSTRSSVVRSSSAEAIRQAARPFEVRIGTSVLMAPPLRPSEEAEPKEAEDSKETRPSRANRRSFLRWSSRERLTRSLSTSASSTESAVWREAFSN